MAAKTKVNFRLSDDALRSVAKLADAMGGSETDAYCEAIPPGIVATIFAYAYRVGHTQGARYGEWVTSLIARSVEDEMLRDPRFPVAAHFLPRGSAGLLDYYVRWLVACDLTDQHSGARQGFADCYEATTGHAPDVYLARVPVGGKWERGGVKGWGVLRRGERFSPDGITTDAPPASAAKPLPVVDVRDLIAVLRSPVLADRIKAGLVLAASLGVGLRLAGDHPADVEHLLAPQLGELLGRAMAGDATAVDELARYVSDRPAAAPTAAPRTEVAQ